MASGGCGACGAEVHGVRTDTAYCSNACRQKAYRWRREVLKRYGSWDNALHELMNKRSMERYR